MLISKNKKNIARGFALMLALVLAFSCVLTACEDKDARAKADELAEKVDQNATDANGKIDGVSGKVDTLTGSLTDVSNKVAGLEEANKSNVTATALAEALASYLKTADLDAKVAAMLESYQKTEDAEKFVTELLEGYVSAETLELALANYVSAETLEDYATTADLAEALVDYATTADLEEVAVGIGEALGEALEIILADYQTKEEATEAVKELLKGYYTKEDVNGLIADCKAEVLETVLDTYVSKENVDSFIVAYLGSDESKEAVLDLISEYGGYIKAEDWNKATADVLVALEKLNNVTNIVASNVYTAENWATYIADLEATFNVTYDKFAENQTPATGKLWIEIIRAIKVDDFAKIDAFVERADAIPTAADDIAAINKMITDLNAAITASGETKIDTDDKDALDDIKEAFVDFDAKYGFNATAVTMETANDTFYTAFCGAPAAADVIAAKLKVNSTVSAGVFYTENLNYVQNAGLNLKGYTDMQDEYDRLIEWAEDIDEMIENLVAVIGEEQTNVDDAMCALIKDVVYEIEGNNDVTPAVVGFRADNNGIVDVIYGYDTYEYYAWLEGKISFDKEKVVAKVNLDDYHAAKAEEFVGSADMNVDIAETVIAAKQAITDLSYGSYKDVRDAREALANIVNTAKADIDNIVARYIFAQEQLAAVAEVEKFTTDNLLDANDLVKAEYTDIAKAVEAYALAIGAIAPDVEGESTTPYKDALEKVAGDKNAALAALELMKDKVDAKLAADALAADLLASEFIGDEDNYDEVKAAITAAAKNTYADIDAATAETIDDVAAAALDAVTKEAYKQVLNLAMAEAQTEVMGILKDAKEAGFAKANEIGDKANAAVIAIRREANALFVLDAADDTKDTWEEVCDIAVLEVTDLLNAFKADAVVDEFLGTLI